MSVRLGDWMQTHSGRRFWPLDPRPDDFWLPDIGEHLARLCRYGGAVKVAHYSVAEHSWHVSHAAAMLAVAARASPGVVREAACWGAIHDAPEGYGFADVVRPLKRAPMMDAYCEAEGRVLRALGERLGLTWPMPPFVKEADTRILGDEKRDVLNDCRVPWDFSPEPLGRAIRGWRYTAARALYMARLRELWPGEVYA